MKKLIIFSVALMAASCMGIDNFDEPSSRFHGTVYDSETKEPILQDQGHTRVRIWERSFKNAESQEIPIKQDGTYNNNKLFPGTYHMLPLGAWWPCDTLRNVPLGSSTKQDFEVTPYLRVIDMETSLEGTSLTVSCRLQAPVTDGLPNIQDCRVFVSLNQFCGADHKLDQYNTNTYRIIASPTAWNTLPKDADGATARLTTATALPLKAGYTYFVRVGATVKDDSQGNKYNYSEIKMITVPD